MYKYFYPKKKYQAIFWYGNEPKLCDFHSRNSTYKNNVECYFCKVDVLIGWIDKTKKTLDICMYLFNSELLSDAVIRARTRGVLVRLIVDQDFVNTTGKMGEIGIPKKVKKNSLLDNLIHHKFVIIDNYKIILGSLNWTTVAFRKNWENLFITNDSRIIVSFKQEFERLWVEL